MARDRGGAVATSSQSSEATVTQRMRVPTNGPHDGDTADPQITPAPGTMDFGAVKVPVPAEGTVVVESSSAGRIQAVHVSVPEGRLSVSALAAPRTGGLWPDLADEVLASLREGGARVRSFTGQWGRELHATTEGATSLFVGVDGPRWMLYGVATGPTRDAVALDARLRRMLRGTVVVRGRAPYPVRTVLPLVTPPGLGGEEQPTTSAPPTMTLRTAAANGGAPTTAIPTTSTTNGSTNGTPLNGVATAGSAPNGTAVGGAAARGAAATGTTADGPAVTGGATNGASVNGNGTASGGVAKGIARWPTAAQGANVTGPNVAGPNVAGPNVAGPNVAGPNDAGGNGAASDRRPHTNGAAWTDGRPGTGPSPRAAAGSGAFPTGALPNGAGPAGTTNGVAPAGARSGAFPAGSVPNGTTWQGAPLDGTTPISGYPAAPAAYDAPSHGGSTSGGFPTGASGATTPYDASASGGFGAGAPPYPPPAGGQGRSGPVDRPDGGRSTGPHAASSGSFPRQNVPTGWAHETGTHRRWTDVPAPQAWSDAQPSLNGQAHPLVPTSSPPSPSPSSSPGPWASPSLPSLSPPHPSSQSQPPQYPPPSLSSLPSSSSPSEAPSPQPTSLWSAARHPDVDAAPPNPPRTRGEGAYRASEPEPTAHWQPEWAEPAARTPDRDVQSPSDLPSATSRWDPLVDPLPGELDPLPDPDPAWHGPLAGDPPGPADLPAGESYGRLDRPIGEPDHLAAEREGPSERSDPLEWSANPIRRQGRWAAPTVSGTTAHSHAAASSPAPTPSGDVVAARRTGRRRAPEAVDDGRHSAAQPPRGHREEAAPRRRREEAAAHHADVENRHAAPTRVPPTQWAWPKEPAPATAEFDAQAGRRAADGARPAAWSAADLLAVGRHGGDRRHRSEPPRHGAPDDAETGRHYRP